MPLLERMKLQKLKITAFKNAGRKEPDRLGSFEAMFNPTSFTQIYEIAYSANQGIGSSGQPANFTRSKPQQLKLKLILDETGVQDTEIVPSGFDQKVTDRVKKFLVLTYGMNDETHEPSFLKVEWGGQADGGLIFECRLKSVTVSYVSFNRNGSPQRAELDILLVADEAVGKRLAEDNLKSPDITHSRIVKSGDTLPLLCKQIYGSSQYYMWVARQNNLDNFRNLTPGQELVFPPLPLER